MVRAEWAIFEEDYWAMNNILDDLLKRGIVISNA